MHHALKRISSKLTKFLHGVTTEDIAGRLVYIQKLSGFVCPVDKKSSRHLFGYPCNACCPFLIRKNGLQTITKNLIFFHVLLLIVRVVLECNIVFLLRILLHMCFDSI